MLANAAGVSTSISSAPPTMACSPSHHRFGRHPRTHRRHPAPPQRRKRKPVPRSPASPPALVPAPAPAHVPAHARRAPRVRLALPTPKQLQHLRRARRGALHGPRGRLGTGKLPRVEPLARLQRARRGCGHQGQLLGHRGALLPRLLQGRLLAPGRGGLARRQPARTTTQPAKPTATATPVTTTLVMMPAALVMGMVTTVTTTRPVRLSQRAVNPEVGRGLRAQRLPLRLHRRLHRHLHLHLHLHLHRQWTCRRHHPSLRRLA